MTNPGEADASMWEHLRGAYEGFELALAGRNFRLEDIHLVRLCDASAYLARFQP